MSYHSPSSFARADPIRYEDWARQANIMLGVTLPTDIRNEYDNLAKLVVPSSLLSALQAAVESSASARIQRFSSLLLQLLRNFRTEQTDDPDRNNIVSQWTHIALAHQKLHECDDYTNEATLRKGVDDIFYLSTQDTSAKIWFEIPVHLRSSSALDRPGPSATADTVIAHFMPLSLATILARDVDSSLAHQASWRDQPSMQLGRLDFMMSAAEYKLSHPQAAFRQLVYDLTAAQSVRKAIGLRDIVMYGWTSNRLALHGVSMTVYACWWLQDTIQFSPPHIVFDLSQPLTCLEFYNFLCNLHKHNADIIEQDSCMDFKGVTSSLMYKAWRAPEDKRKNTKPPSPYSRDDGTAQSPQAQNSHECFEDHDSEGDLSDVSNDYPTTLQNLHEADQILGNYGEDKEHHGRMYHTTFGWIGKYVPQADWAKRVIAHGEEDSILADDDFLLEVPVRETAVYEPHNRVY